MGMQTASYENALRPLTFFSSSFFFCINRAVWHMDKCITCIVRSSSSYVLLWPNRGSSFKWGSVLMAVNVTVVLLKPQSMSHVNHYLNSGFTAVTHGYKWALQQGLPAFLLCAVGLISLGHFTWMFPWVFFFNESQHSWSNNDKSF